MVSFVPGGGGGGFRWLGELWGPKKCSENLLRLNLQGKSRIEYVFQNTASHRVGYCSSNTSDRHPEDLDHSECGFPLSVQVDAWIMSRTGHYWDLKQLSYLFKKPWRPAHFLDIQLTDGGEVSLTHRPLFTP
jgi:hypothetical protein